MADPGVYPGLATRLMCRKLVDHGEPKPGTLTHRLGREEWIKSARHHLRRHTRTGVAHGNGHIVTWRHVLAPRRRLIEQDVGGLDRKPAAILHGIAGIDAQIKQGVSQLVGVT